MSIGETVLKKEYHHAPLVLVDDSILKRATAASWEYPADEALNAELYIAEICGSFLS